MSHKAAKSMAKLISQSCGDAGCLLAKGRWSHLKATRDIYPSTRGRQTGLRERPELKQTVHLSAVVDTYPVGALM